MKNLRAKHLILGFSIPFVLYAILGGFLGRALARDSTYRYLSVFQDVVTHVMNFYVEQPEMDEVMDGAIRGMMDALDTDSCYLTPEEYEAFTTPEAQAKADIGVEVTKRYYIQVVAVLAGSPAEAAGLAPGDLLKSIDGKNTREVNVIVGDAMLRGRAGSKLELEVIRGRQPKPIAITVNRRDVVSSPVEFELLKDGTGYVHITSFRAGTATDVRRSLEMLKGQGAERIVVDLRNSFGRIAADGAHVAELFVAGGVAARLQSRKGETTDVTLASDRVAFATAEAPEQRRSSPVPSALSPPPCRHPEDEDPVLDKALEILEQGGLKKRRNFVCQAGKRPQRHSAAEPQPNAHQPRKLRSSGDRRQCHPFG